MDEHDEMPPAGDNGALEGAAADRDAPVTETVRIAALEAGVAARADRALDGPDPLVAPLVAPLEASAGPLPSAIELPDWADPPTGQVPRVLLEQSLHEDPAALGSATKGPTWRQDAADWDEDLGLGTFEEIGSETSAIAGRSSADSIEDPFRFDFEELDAHDTAAAAHVAALASAPEVPVHFDEVDDGADDDQASDAAWAAFLADDDEHDEDASMRTRPIERVRPASEPIEAPSPDDEPIAYPTRRRERRAGRRARLARAPRGEHRTAAPAAHRHASARATSPTSRRNPLIATATGLVFGAIALACFWGGSVPALVLVTVVATIAAGEAFGTMRAANRRPATVLGLASVVCLVVGSYLYGPFAIGDVLACAVVLCAAWYLVRALRPRSGARPSTSAATDLALTLLVVCWVGVLASFAGLLLAPRLFPDRHGVAFVLGAIILTIAHDVGSYAAGATVGRHRIVPSVSPNKSLEGLLGGCALTFVVAGLVVAAIHPITLATALGLAALVCVLGPLGDLTESLVKRDLGVKDMGNLLPEHGGLFDRVDALLFVLPAAFFLFSLANLR